MKKNLNILIETFLKFVTHILGKINPGRYILDELNKNIIKKKKTIVFKDFKLIFYTPNRLCYYRLNTIQAKEPETLEWIGKFKDKDFSSLYKQIWAK